MSEFDTNQWTKEDNFAFELWLKISVEMIEKYYEPDDPSLNSSIRSPG